MEKPRRPQKQLPWPWEIISDTELILSLIYKVEAVKPPENPLQRILFASEKLPRFRFIQIFGKTLDRIEERPPHKPEHSWWLIAHDLWKLARRACVYDSPQRRMRHHLGVVTQRGRQWKEHHSEQFLCPCAMAVFNEICYRAGHNSWDIPFEEAVKKNEVKFPWAFAGIESLIDSIPLHRGKGGQLVPYTGRQIQRSLAQLEHENRIKRINRGYEGRGASKYHIFLTPGMADAFKFIFNKVKVRKVTAEAMEGFKNKSMVHQHQGRGGCGAAIQKPKASVDETKRKLNRQADLIKKEHPEDWKPIKKPS